MFLIAIKIRVLRHVQLKLQRVQNALCRIIFRLDKMSHVTPFLKRLHWLPIQHRILFKYNLLVFKAINLSQTPYLSALIRSSSFTRGNRLSVSSTRPKKHIGRRGFAVAAPADWNKLLQTVRSRQTIDGFRSQLKTQAGIPPTLVIPWWVLFGCRPMSVPGLSLLGLKRTRGFVSILRSINPTIIIMFVRCYTHDHYVTISVKCLKITRIIKDLEQNVTWNYCVMI